MKKSSSKATPKKEPSKSKTALKENNRGSELKPKAARSIADANENTEYYKHFDEEELENEDGSLENNNIVRNPKVKNSDLYIIGIGTSAGGLESLKTFFDYVPTNFPHSFVIVQHLSPDYKSLMAELISRNTLLRCFEVDDKMEIEPGSIYLIPPKKTMTISNGKLYLTDRDPQQGLHLPIDIFFKSLADDRHEKAIGIILSGTGSDGTRGIKAIKEAGGMVMVQSPETAKFDGMPNSAISTNMVDYILPIERMPEELLNYFPSLDSSLDSKENKILKDEETLLKIFAHLKKYNKQDFTFYKRPTLVRRISKRMSQIGVKEVKFYYDYLLERPEEVEILTNEFLIGVTKFFRDVNAFNALEKKVIPEIVKKADAHNPIKIWCVACSTGEEAYSYGILIKEELIRQNKLNVDVKIFATDIDKNALEKASKGEYVSSNLENVSESRLQNNFTRIDDTFKVNPDIRKMIIFSKHNALTDPPFNKCDLICCRNLLIYLQPVMQRKLISTFHYFSKPNGYLFLGTSETLADKKTFYEELDSRWKIFKKLETEKSFNFQSLHYPDFNPRVKETAVSPTTTKRLRDEYVLADVLNGAILSELNATCLYINENFDIIHALGNINDYLSIPNHVFSVNLQKMVPSSIALMIGSSVRKVKKTKDASWLRNIKYKDKDNIKYFDLLVKPFWFNKNFYQNYYMVIFLPSSNKLTTKELDQTIDLEGEKNENILELEGELKELRENLQATIEEVETSNEELQATIEELIASNEELQSTNEELHTVNTELHTVNGEYQKKIMELASLNADMDNLLASTEIGTIFLDTDLRIRLFTPAIKEIFNLLPMDKGRPIANFNNNIEGIDLLKIAEDVLHNDTRFEKEVKSKKGKWFLIKLLPYKNEYGKKEGVVITLIDMHELVETRTKLKEQSGEIKPLLESIKMEITSKKTKK